MKSIPKKPNFELPKIFFMNFRFLDKAQIGELFLAIFIHERNGELPKWYGDDSELSHAFEYYEEFSRISNNAYLDKIKKYRDAGSLGGKAKAANRQNNEEPDDDA